MKVVKAKHAGACYGVQRALDLAHEASSLTHGAATLGQLIHNPRVVKTLEERGVQVVDRVADVTQGAVIIRSHGVTPSVLNEVKERDLALIDATCPHVSRAQKAAAELARNCGCVVVVGEAGHPEVESLLAWATEAQARVVAATEPTDLPDDLPSLVGIVVQTTQTKEALCAIQEELSARGIKTQVKDTICFATRQRQEAAAELSGQVDALVVIGGKNSSNTTRLAEICAAQCDKTYHVESVSELNPSWFVGVETVGVTAGASTPEEHIEEVVAYLTLLER